MRSELVLIAGLTVGLVQPKPLLAGLSGPGESFVIQTADGKRIFVGLASGRTGQDLGNFCTLPVTGEQVELRNDFPASGLYDLRVGNRTPLWTLSLPNFAFGEQNFLWLSRDGRYLVYVNRFGANPPNSGRQTNWAIRFYDQGKEIKTYSVEELIDFPSLMEFTTWDSHDLWFSDLAYDPNVDDRRLSIRTSCHEWYTFDVPTGRIVSEFRLWRTLRWTLFATMAVGGICLAALIRRRRRSCEVVRAAAGSLNFNAATECPPRFQFGLRPILLGFVIVSILLTIGRSWPHVAVFASSILFAALLTRVAWITRLRGGAPSTLKQRNRRRAIVVGVIAAWFLPYFLSISPVGQLTSRWPPDVRMVIFQVPYAPIFWLVTETPIGEWECLKRYDGWWRAWPDHP